MSFDLSKFRNEFLQSDGWKVSDCYKPHEDKFLRKDAQDAYEGAKWGFEAGTASRQTEVDKLQIEVDCLKVKLDAANERALMLLDHKNEMVDKLQTEIDTLQNRIDGLKVWCTNGVECGMLSTTYNQALIDMLKILKGV